MAYDRRLGLNPEVHLSEEASETDLCAWWEKPEKMVVSACEKRISSLWASAIWLHRSRAAILDRKKRAGLATAPFYHYFVPTSTSAPKNASALN